jgi:hypothetical protein
VEVYVVVTVFQGVFDEAKGFKTSKEADDYVAQLKADFGESEKLDIRNLVLEI